uniref:Uncharacterized protein n=1 Tax=Panagrolaimus sp. ES5 TaxID=591445 RepID=A0AC34FUY4_9BILA
MGNPMALAKRHKEVRFRSSKNSHYSKFYYCETSKCNTNPFKALQYKTSDFEFINPEPNSFDSKLWPTLIKKRNRRNKKLKNMVIIEKEIKERTSSVGYVSPNATKAWVQFQFLNASGAINNVRLTMNIVNFTLTFEAGSIKKTIPWRKIFYSRVGRPRIDFDVWFSPKSYSFYANVVNTNFTVPFKATGELITKFFGGKWEHIVFSESKIGFSRSPSKKLSCNENTKFDASLNVTNISNKIITDNATLFLPMITDYETKNFEFRKSLCPGSDLFRFEITSVEHPDGDMKLHSNLWIRKNLQWFQEYSFNIFISDEKNCTNIEMEISEKLIIFRCNKDVLHLLQFNSLLGTKFTFFTNDIKYLVFENKKKFICVR